MTESASGTPGTGDEQRTTALPRPGQPPPVRGAPPPTPSTPGAPPTQSPADVNATTMLPRPDSWPAPTPAPSNIPGAVRGPSTPPQQPSYPVPPEYSSSWEQSRPQGYPPAAGSPYSPGYPPEDRRGWATPGGPARPWDPRPTSDPRGAPDRGYEQARDRRQDRYPPPADYGAAENYHPGEQYYPQERHPTDRGGSPTGRRASDATRADYGATGQESWHDRDYRGTAGGYGDPYDSGRDDRGHRPPGRRAGAPYDDPDRDVDDPYAPDDRQPPDGRYAPEDRYPAGDRYPPDRRYADDRYAQDDGYPWNADSQRGPDDRRRAAGGRTPGRSAQAGRPSHLPPYQEPLPLAPAGAQSGQALGTAGVDSGASAAVPPGTGGRAPRKLTVTRVAALRSRELTHRGIEKFHGAVSADGADRSGLTHLTYAVMANYAVDAALAVALANTLFFAAAKADSTGKVLLYLLLTVAPFAVIAPLIGPLLDRIQSGRRIALAVSSFGRALLALTMALKFDSWVIYPCALGMLVLSKSFGVLKAALTPRVLPEEITLVKTNSRLSVFGLIAGGVAGGIAAGISWLANSPGALVFTAACAVVCGVLCLRIPAWVESTEGEVPVRQRRRDPKQRVFPPAVSATLWTNATIRIETGFLALFIAFVVKSLYQSSSVVAPPDGSVPPPPHPTTGFMQLLLLGAVGAAAGAGGFVGNALGARLTLRNPERVAVFSLGAIILSVIVAILVPGLITAGLVAFVGSTGSSLAKVCLDSVIQRDLPEVNRASAFGRSESVLQLSWVFGGVIGLLVGGVWALSQGAVFVVGFAIVAVILVVCGAQCVAMSVGKSLLPALHLGSSGRKKSGQADAAGTTRLTATMPEPTVGGPAAGAGAGGRPGGDGTPPTRKRTPRKAGDPR